MPRRIVTLTTDYGLSDHFAGTLKGVILGINPGALVVDITHEVTPFEIAEGGFVVAQAYRFFPKGSIHVVVIDPGVGTLRRPILAEAGGHFFVAPDNGVLSLIYEREERRRVRAITAERYFLKPVSNTFHGRDIFAPVAAHLSRGVAPGRFGKAIKDYARQEFYRPVRTGKRFWSGTILKVDRFGNLITNFHIGEFPVVETRPFEAAVGAERVRRFVRTFAECPAGELALMEGSSGFLEIAANQGSAAKRTGCGVGAPVELML